MRLPLILTAGLVATLGALVPAQSGQLEPDELAFARRVIKLYEATSSSGAPDLADVEALLQTFDEFSAESHARLAPYHERKLLRYLVDLVELHERAETMCDDAIEMCSERFGSAHPMTVGAWIDKSRHYWMLDQLGDANDCLRTAGEALGEEYGSDPKARSIRRQISGMLYENLMALGDFAAARDVAEVRSQDVAPAGSESSVPQRLEDFDFLAMAEYRLGHLDRARDLYEAKLAVLEALDQPDELDLAMAMQQLASLRAWFGDFPGGISLMERVLEIRKRRLPEGDPRRLRSLTDLGGMLCDSGQHEAALVHLEEVVAAHGEALHHAAFLAKSSLAMALVKAGRIEDALEVQRPLLDHAEATMGPEVRELHMIRLQMAENLRVQGRVAEALELAERALDGASKILPPSHTYVRQSKLTAAKCCERLGRWERAAEWALDHSRVAADTLLAEVLPLRASLERAEAVIDAVETPTSQLMAMEQSGRSESREELLSAALRARAVIRGTALRVSRRISDASAQGGAREERLRSELADAVDQIQRHHTAGDREAYDRAVRRRERIERQLQGRDGQRTGRTDPVDPADMAAGLAPGSAAAALVDYRHRLHLPKDPSDWLAEWRCAAFVLHRSGAIEFVDLGTFEDMEAAIGARGPAARRALRQRLVDPILAAAGDIDTLYYSGGLLTDFVPIDCLSFDDGALIGSRISVRRIHSLSELASTRSADLPGDVSLLALGAIDYAEADAGPKAELGLRSSAEQLEVGRPESFSPLPFTKTEVEKIAAMFHARFDREGSVLTGSSATERTLFEQVGGATVVHIATHGYFEFGDEGRNQRFDTFTPFLHCGLALAGANLGTDRSGLDPGILTAQEVLRLDLTECELAVLSACDSSAGVDRLGQGASSLHTAFHGAGARFVLSSLWKVGDASTEKLMVAFYRNLWSEGMPPHDALWQAREALRRTGVPFRDWAGWILTGR